MGDQNYSTTTALNKIERDLIEESKRIITSNKGETGKYSSKYNKPPTVVSAKDWFKVGLSAFEKNEYDEALKAWAKVLQLLDQKEEPELYSVTLMNQGITYGQQDKLEDSLSSYATLIEQFKDSSNEEVQIQVAKAMVNQSMTYGQQGKSDDKLNSYAAVIEQFKDSSNEEIQIRVAKAMANQVVFYGRQKDFTAALNLHSQLLEQFKGSSNEEIQIQVANSRGNIAELALIYETPEQVLTRVAEAEKYSDNSDNSENLAVMQFIRFLLNDKTIEEVFTALTKTPIEMDLTWNFSEIKGYLIDNFEGIKQQQVQAVVQYFEQHKDIEQLGVELGIKG